MSALSKIFGQIGTLGGQGKQRRRVTDGIDDLEEEELPDVSDAANQQSQSSGLDQAAPAFGSPVLDSQSSDVRQNELIDPEKERKREIYEGVGRGLGNYVLQNGRTQPNQEFEAPQGVPDDRERIAQGYNQFRDEIEPLPQIASGLQNYVAQNGQLQPNAEAQIPAGIPDDVEKNAQDYNEFSDEALQAPLQPPASPEEKLKVDRNELLDAIEHPFERGVEGAAQEVSASPELQRELKVLTGADWNEEIASEVESATEAINNINKPIDELQGRLTQEAESLLQKIKAGETTDADKYLIGLALALPLVIGGFYGSEAAFAALGGAGEGFSKAFERRGEETVKNRQLLSDVNKQIAALEGEKRETPKKAGLTEEDIRKRVLSEKPVHLKGRKVVEITNPETGQKEIEGVELLPGLVAPLNLVSEKEQAKEMDKVARTVADAKGYAVSTAKSASEIAEIASQIKNKKALQSAIVAIASGEDVNKYLKLLSQDVIVDGKKVNAGVALKTRLGLLAVDYAKSHQLGQIDAALQRHLQDLFSNPATTFRSGEDLIHQMDTLVNFTIENIIDKATSQGFNADDLRKNLLEETQVYHKGKQKRNEQPEATEWLSLIK